LKVDTFYTKHKSPVMLTQCTNSQLLLAWAVDYFNYDNKHCVPWNGDTCIFAI